MTQTCDSTEPLIQAYLDGELEIEPSHDVEAHLSECASCREVQDELGVLGESLRALYTAHEATDIKIEIPGVVAPAARQAGVADTGEVNAAVAAWAKKKKKTPPAPIPVPVATPSGLGTLQRRIGGYEVKSEIARGGMGCVYRALQLSMDRMVALKVLKSELCQNEKYVARFLREARVAATIAHPNLVSIYDVGHDDDRLYYSMELVEGEDGEQILDRQGHLPQPEAVRIAIGVAQALVAAKQASVIHRDIKPANILVTKEGGVKLADLGLAKDVDDLDSTLTRSKTIIGSPNYMSPEQAEDLRNADHRSDVYMLGATLLHFLCGAAPFGKGSPIEILARVLRDDLVLPDLLPGGQVFDPRLKAVVSRCMAKDPGDRYPDASGLLRDLEGFLAGGKLPTAKVQARGKSRRTSKRTTSRLRRGSSDGKVRGLDSSTGRVAARQQRNQRIPPIYIAAAAAAFLLALALGILGGSGASTNGDSDDSVDVVDMAPTAPIPEAPRKRLVSDTQESDSPDEPGTEDDVDSTNASDGEDSSADEDSSVDEDSSEDETDVVEAEIQLAGLLRWRDENPDLLGEIYTRATAFADEFPSGTPGEQARLLAESSETRLRELIEEAEGEANDLEAAGRLFEAEQLYAAFVSDNGKHAPGCPQAVLAQRSLGNQIRTNLQGDREKLDALISSGDAEGAEAVLARIDRYAGQVQADKIRGGVETALQAFADARAAGDDKDTDKDKDKDDPASAAASALAQAKPLFDRVRNALAQGELAQATRLLERVRERFGENEALEAEVAELTEAVASAKKKHDGPELEALLAAVLHGDVEVLGDGRVSLAYGFKNPAELEDWKTAEAPRDRGQKRLHEFLADQPMRRKPGYEAWSLQRGHLVGYGHTRKEFAVSFSPQAPITVDVEAKGKQNLLVSFRGNRTLVGGLGYMLEQLPIAKMGRGGGGDGLRKFLDRLDRTIDQSRKRGPSLALFVEESLLTHKELLALPVKLKSKSKFSVELNAEEKELRVRVKKVDEAASFERKIGGKDVRVSLLTMGAVVGYDRVTITGKLSESFLNRLRSAARDAGGDLDKLPEQFRKNERDRLKRESERARDRGRDRDDDEDD